MVVVLPTPLTPTVRITNGLASASMTSGLLTGASIAISSMRKATSRARVWSSGLKPVFAPEAAAGGMGFFLRKSNIGAVIADNASWYHPTPRRPDDEDSAWSCPHHRRPFARFSPAGAGAARPAPDHRSPARDPVQLAAG